MEAQEVIRHISALSYLGIFGTAFLANVVIPVPEEVIILAIGYVVGLGHINFWITTGLVILGMLISDVIMFALSLHGNKLVRLAYDKFFAKLVPMNDEFIQKHINKIIFVSRFLINLRFIGPFLAGQAKVSYKKFIVLDGVAIIVYAVTLIWAGNYFHNRIAAIFEGAGMVKNIILVVIGIMLLIMILRAVKNAFIKFELKGK